MGSTTVQAAPQRNYAQETQDTLATQIALAPELYASEAQYQPQYNQLQLQLAEQAMFGVNGQKGLLQQYGESAPQFQNIQQGLNTQQRTADIQDVANLAPAAQAAFKAANPELFAQMEQAKTLQASNNQPYNQLNAFLKMPPSEQNIAAQQIAGPNINAQMVGRENTGFNNINTMDVNAQQMASPGSVQAQQLSAAQVAAPGTVGAERVGAALIETPAQVEARNVRARAMQAQQVAAPQQVQAGLIQSGTLGASLYGQALNAGPSKISSALESAVLNNLTADGSLSAAEQRQAEQQVRASYAARGMAMSPQAISAEVQNRLVNQRQRAVENMGLAGQVNQQLQSEQAANRGFAGNVYGQDVSMQQQNIGNQFAAGQFNAQTGLQAALANQAAGNQMTQQNASNQLQAQLANQQAGLQAGQFNASTSIQAQQANQDALLRAQLANQQAGIQTGQFNAQTGLQAGLANQSAENQMALANQQAALQAGQFNVNTQAQLQAQNQDAALRAALANQQVNMQGQQFNATNQSQVAQANRDAAMQSSLANQAANLQQQQLMAQYGYQTQAANQQANLGTAESNRAYQAQQLQNYYQNLGQAGQLYNQGLGADRAYAAQLVGLQQATMSDPYAAILGRSSTAGNVAQNTTNQGMNLSNMAGPALFNPESSYANNIYGGNQQSTNAANIATAQSNAAVIGGLAQGLGSAAGGFLSKPPCWVAREVYGINNPKWRRFRTWLLTRAPKWFHDAYIKYGENFAEFISDKPRTKSLIRRWMDSRIATLK
jgi:hypothetical protein